MGKPFLSKFLKQVFFAVGAVVAAALILELGFRLRDWRQHVTLMPPVLDSGVKTVLLIGDSVLGTPDSGMGRYLEADLRRRGGGAFAVRNISRPKNSSGWVNSYLSDYLRDYHPQYVILLLGKSDFSDSQAVIGEPTWLHNLKIYRLYQLAIEEAKKLAQRLERKNPRKLSRPQDAHLKILRDWYLRDRRQTVEKLVSLPVSQALKSSKKYYSYCLAMALKTREQPQLFPRAQECMRDLEKSEIPPAYLSSIKSEVARGFIQLEQLDAAKDLFLEALHLNADNILAQIDLGFLLASRGECPQAIPYFENALRKVNRGVSEMCLKLYNCFVREKREQEGEAFF